MARFFDIASPPQSLERLDLWGPLDSLPASLDSPLWQRAGLYGFEAGAQAASDQSLNGRRIALLTLEGRAAASATLRGGVVFVRGRGEARSGGLLSLLRLRPLGLPGRAESVCGLLLLPKGWNWRGAEQNVCHWQEEEKERRAAWL